MSGFNPENTSDEWPDYDFDKPFRADDEPRVQIPPKVKIAAGGIAVAGLMSAVYVVARKRLYKDIEE